MSKLRHSDSGKFEKVASRSIKTIPSGGGEGTGIRDITYSNKFGGTVCGDFTGDSSERNSPVINDLGRDTSLGNNVGVKRDLRDGNSNPSASIRNLPPNSDLRKRNNKAWDVQK